MSAKQIVSGEHFHRALAYAFQICPKAEGKERMSHVVFVENKIVCADGERFHLGLLPDEIEYGAFAVTRTSIDELLKALAYTGQVARRRSTDFSVVLGDGEVEIKYGVKRSLVHELEECIVGPIPKKWVEPVKKNAPELLGSKTPELNCDHMRTAMSWHRSWEKNSGGFTWRGDPGGWVRLDITAESAHVATAFLLPTTAVPAQLPPDEPLLNRGKKEPAGQSVLSLSLDIHEAPPEPAGEPRVRKGKKGKAKAEEPTDGDAGGAE